MQGRRNVKTFGRVQAWKAKPAPLIGIGVKLIYKDTVPVLMSSHVPVVLIYVSRYRGSVNKWLEINPSSMYIPTYYLKTRFDLVSLYFILFPLCIVTMSPGSQKKKSKVQSIVSVYVTNLQTALKKKVQRH